MEEKRNNRIITYTHKLIDLLNFKIEDIDIIDIAQSLSNHCRFNGFCDGFYSVAEHSYLLSIYDFPGNSKWRLLHDAAEAYTTDIPSPYKVLVPEMVRIEDKILKLIGEKFNLEPWTEELHKIIKKGDIELRNSEALLLGLGHPELPWGVDISKAKYNIYCFDQDKSYNCFMKRFTDLF